MLTYNVNPPPGDVITPAIVEGWANSVPSLRTAAKFSDGSVNVDVADNEADDLTDLWDESGLEYNLL